MKAARTGIPAEHNSQEAVLRFIEGNIEKRSLRDEKDHLQKLDSYIRDKRRVDIHMEMLRPFVRHRKQVDGVATATVNRALEIALRILYLASDDCDRIVRVTKVRMLTGPKRRVRFFKEEKADRMLELPIPQPKAYLGELPRNVRNRFVGVYGVG